MRVTATAGLRVPLEGKARQFIEHDPGKPVDVPDTSYYRRRLAAGELIEVAEAASVGAKKTAKGAAE
jgi:hypothetical protein